MLISLLESGVGVLAASDKITEALSSIFKGKGFEEGGLTGGTGSKEVRGIVHSNEYVSPSKQLKKYPNLIGALDLERKSGSLDMNLVGRDLPLPADINVRDEARAMSAVQSSQSIDYNKLGRSVAGELAPIIGKAVGDNVTNTHYGTELIDGLHNLVISEQKGKKTVKNTYLSGLFPRFKAE